MIQYPRKFYEDPYPKKLVDWLVGQLVRQPVGQSGSWLVGREGRREGERGRREGREGGRDR